MSTSGQDAYATIRERIIAGEYAMGDRLGEVELATLLGVSRTPIREALRRLSADGLVEIEANRGARVALWTPADLDEIYELRAMLEGHAATRAASRVTPEDLVDLAALCDQMDKAVAGGITRSANLDLLVDGNREFHSRIMSVASNARLHRLTDLLFQVPLSIHTYRHYSSEELARSMRHHREILRALRYGDGQWAGSVMRAHIHAARHSAPETDHTGAAPGADPM